MREILTPEEVADYLQLTSDTIYRLIRENRLAATKIGRNYRVPKEDLDAFIITNSTRPLVRKRLREQLDEIHKRNSDIDGDQLLIELEEEDEKRRLTKQ